MAPKSKRPLHADTAEREPSYRHKAFADWLSEVTGSEVDVKSVQLAVSLVNKFRQTPEAAAAEDAYHAEREAEKAAKKAEQADAVRARAQKLQAQAAELLSKADDIAPAKKAAAKKAPAKKAAPVVEADEVGAKRAAKKAPAKKATAPPSSVDLGEDVF